MKTFSLRLPDDLGKWLEKQAKKARMSMNLFIIQLLDNKKKPSKK